jgi:hypothetical protein
MAEILANSYYVEAIFEDGQPDGEHVVGWTKNGMRVRLLVADLPFSLADLTLNTKVRGPNGANYYAIDEDQRTAMLAALEAKVKVSEEYSKTAPAALV